MKESMMKNQVSVCIQMNKLIVILPLFLLSMCSDAPVTPPVGAFELEVEESHWDNVYRAIEYLKQAESNLTQPSDAINSALEEF